MRAYKYIPIVLSLLLMASCTKETVYEGTDMHDYTQEELQKKKVDDAVATFLEAFKLETIEEPVLEVIANSKITLPAWGTIRYTYTKDDVVLITLDAKLNSFTADLYGGLHLEGKSLFGEGTEVYLDGEKIATLDFVVLDYTEEGKQNRQVMPVLRFEDGTSYSLSGFLLVDPLIDYLLANVFSAD